MLDAARIAAGETVLELGAGTGLLTQAAAGRVSPDGEVIALDPSAARIEELPRVVPAPNVSYVLGSADVLPLPDGAVHVAVGRSALPDVADLGEAARELFRVLRPGGRVSLLERVGERARGAAEGDPSPPGEAEPAEQLRRAGFVDVEAAVAEQDEPWQTITARKP